MFVYFQGNNEFVVEYATEMAQKEIRACLAGIWPDGVDESFKKDAQPGPHLHIKFHGTPWNMSGSHKEQ